MDTPEKELLNEDTDFDSFLAECRSECGEEPEISESSEPETNRNAYADRQTEAAPMKKDNSIRTLIILIILELLGIAGVAAWWILRLL